MLDQGLFKPSECPSSLRLSLLLLSARNKRGGDRLEARSGSIPEIWGPQVLGTPWQLAETQEQIHQRLLEITPTASEELAAAWQATTESHLETLAALSPPGAACPVQFLILVTCRDEKQQVELLGRLGAEGLECKALVS